jgi:hypothetical protein
VRSIRATGAKLAVPGLVNLSDLAAEADGVSRIVSEAVQELLLKLALQMAREDYETRRERQSQGTTNTGATSWWARRKKPAPLPETLFGSSIVFAGICCRFTKSWYT